MYSIMHYSQTIRIYQFPEYRDPESAHFVVKYDSGHGSSTFIKVDKHKQYCCSPRCFLVLRRCVTIITGID